MTPVLWLDHVPARIAHPPLAMGIWSITPYGNDSTADWLWHLRDARSWTPIAEALATLLLTDGEGWEGRDAMLIGAGAADIVAAAMGRPHAGLGWELPPEATRYLARVAALRPDSLLPALADGAVSRLTGPVLNPVPAHETPYARQDRLAWEETYADIAARLAPHPEDPWIRHRPDPVAFAAAWRRLRRQSLRAAAAALTLCGPGVMSRLTPMDMAPLLAHPAPQLREIAQLALADVGRRPSAPPGARRR